MNVKLGFDLNCFANRYLEPEAWTDLVAACGIRVVQFNFDIIDFLLPRKVQERLAEQTRHCCRSKNIRIKCAFGGHNHHQNYLGHPDDEAAACYEKFYKKMADLTALLGGEGFGTCFAITTAPVQRDPERRAQIVARAIEAYHRLAAYAKAQGLKYLLYETTSTPRETCATFAENDEVLARLKDAAIPMLLCLDVGHRNQATPGAPETDPHAWIRKYGRVAPLIHIQQCNADGSHHWPFLPEFNRKGDIVPEKILEAIRDSGADHEILLALEVRHRAYYPDEYKIEDNLKESIRYWRQWIKE
ncbi:MAG: sugar phosphate isomerase/epimerase [Kiritimatiellaeota bacterium]|nr:sugar phosphate isomerase/epimerase [Kiritimatiellota bacterium]